MKHLELHKGEFADLIAWKKQLRKLSTRANPQAGAAFHAFYDHLVASEPFTVRITWIEEATMKELCIPYVHGWAFCRRATPKWQWDPEGRISGVKRRGNYTYTTKINANPSRHINHILIQPWAEAIVKQAILMRRRKYAHNLASTAMKG